jgi:hypothetical protein
MKIFRKKPTPKAFKNLRRQHLLCRRQFGLARRQHTLMAAVGIAYADSVSGLCRQLEADNRKPST